MGNVLEVTECAHGGDRMTTPGQNVEVAIAEISRDIKYIAKRLDDGTMRFDLVEARVAKLEDHVNRLYGGLVLASVVVPIALKFMEK
jgi:hypothetical protein